MRYIELAKEVALRGDPRRKHFLGAVAIRTDGVVVSSSNGTWLDRAPTQHAEAKVLRKAGRGAILFVARVGRNGTIGLSMPCRECRQLIRNKGVKRVYFTIDAIEIGTFYW